MNQRLEETALFQEPEKTRRQGYELFHNGVLGRCPECGRLIMLPCLACATRENEMEEETRPIDLQPELYEWELQRYKEVHDHREKYGVSMFHDEISEQEKTTDSSGCHQTKHPETIPCSQKEEPLICQMKILKRKP